MIVIYSPVCKVKPFYLLHIFISLVLLQESKPTNPTSRIKTHKPQNMKNLYDKNKGKVHPSPPSRDALSLLNNLLPAAVITVASALSVSDREVLAYLITRSISNDVLEDKRNCKCKKFKPTKTHKSPLFNCDCFDCFNCYTFYWSRWNSSPNRELIHQAIEAFEDQHFAHNEPSKSTTSTTKSKKKDKKVPRPGPEPALNVQDDSFPASTYGGESAEAEVFEVPAWNDRRFGRKSWPDVLGMFHSRLWSLWGPNI